MCDSFVNIRAYLAKHLPLAFFCPFPKILRLNPSGFFQTAVLAAELAEGFDLDGVETVRTGRDGASRMVVDRKALGQLEVVEVGVAEPDRIVAGYLGSYGGFVGSVKE